MLYPVVMARFWHFAETEGYHFVVFVYAKVFCFFCSPSVITTSRIPHQSSTRLLEQPASWAHSSCLHLECSRQLYLIFAKLALQQFGDRCKDLCLVVDALQAGFVSTLCRSAKGHELWLSWCCHRLRKVCATSMK